MINKPSKILYVIDSYSNPNAGTEGQLFQLIKHLDRDKFSPQLLVFKQSEWLENNTFPCLVEVLGASSIKSIQTWHLLYKKAKKYKAEGFKLAHIYFNDASVICPPAFYFCGIKTIISRRDMGYWYNAIYRFLLPITGKFVTNVLVNSKAVGNITHQVEKIPNNRILVIYNGYKIDTQSLPLVEELINFKGESILLGIIANIRPIKRMQDAIEALAKLREYNAKLVIIGAGEPCELLSLSRKLNIEDRILFLGSRSDITACLQYLDIGLLCSESEGFSNAIVEYQFSSLPVICSRVGGNSEAIIDNETGYLYPMGDVDKLAEKIKELIENPRLRKVFGDMGYDNAHSKYTIASMMEAHQNCYQGVLDKVSK